ncbi:hypothetical protein MRX96_020694 [Rhipicephalus microplus]
MERQRKIAALKLLIILKRRRAFLKKYWVRPTWANRAGEREFFTAMKEMKNGDESLFYSFYRMSPATFGVLHSLVKEKLTKDQCPSREPISSRGAPRADFEVPVIGYAGEGGSHGIPCGH